MLRRACRRRSPAGKAARRLQGRDVVVAGLPRGGVPVAFEVARLCGRHRNVVETRRAPPPGTRRGGPLAKATSGSLMRRRFPGRAFLTGLWSPSRNAAGTSPGDGHPLPSGETPSVPSQVNVAGAHATEIVEIGALVPPGDATPIRRLCEALLVDAFPLPRGGFLHRSTTTGGPPSAGGSSMNTASPGSALKLTGRTVGV